MGKLAARASEALQEKHPQGRGRWSSFRLVHIFVTFGWLARFLAEPAAIFTLMVQGVTPPPLTPLGQPMAWVGVFILLAGPLRRWMEATAPEAIPQALAGFGSALVGAGGARSGWGGMGRRMWGGSSQTPRQPPLEGLVTDADPEHAEGDEL